MTIVDFNQGSNKRILLGLGFFDSVHIGHQRIIAEAVRQAEARRAVPALFTFTNDPAGALPGGKDKLVLTFEERLLKLERLGIGLVVAASFGKEFCAMPREKFLRKLLADFNLAGVVCGADYRFGAGAAGDVEYLNEGLAQENVPVTVMEFLRAEGEKVSTSAIAELLEQGNIEKANALLGEPFAISGVVGYGHQIGRTLGFPTANIPYPAGKVQVRPAVYLTETLVEGKRYQSISNVGARPTFGDCEFKVETYLDGFCGDLYGKTVTVSFYKHLRDGKKFDSPEQLARQLEQDKKAWGEQSL